jgi:two-component system LytT family response regulator
MIRAIVVDDEAVARRRIKRLLTAEPDIVVVAEAGDGRAAIEAIRRERPDLVFLDVQMPEADGLAVVRALGNDVPHVVFVTAFDRYALEAFEVHALDYLLKPFSPARLHASLARARAAIAGSGTRAPADRLAGLLGELRSPPRYLARFVVRTGDRVLLVDAGQVDWIEAADNYAVLHVGRASHALRDTLTRLATELDPARFVRIHRSTIVQIDRVRELRPAFHGDYVVVLKDDTRLGLSRTYRPQIEALLGRTL